MTSSSTATASFVNYTGLGNNVAATHSDADGGLTTTSVITIAVVVPVLSVGFIVFGVCFFCCGRARRGKGDGCDDAADTKGVSVANAANAGSDQKTDGARRATGATIAQGSKSDLSLLHHTVSVHVSFDGDEAASPAAAGPAPGVVVVSPASTVCKDDVGTGSGTIVTSRNSNDDDVLEFSGSNPMHSQHQLLQHAGSPAGSAGTGSANARAGFEPQAL